MPSCYMSILQPNLDHSNGLQTGQPDHKVVGPFKNGPGYLKSESGSTSQCLQLEMGPTHALDDSVPKGHSHFH